jgi:putative hemolysin
MLPYLVILLLSVISALFSGSETVLFSLSRHDRSRMKKSDNRLEKLAATLLENPRYVLTTLMLGNMTCNVLIFVLSAILLTRQGGETELFSIGYGFSWTYLHVVILSLAPPLLVTYVSDVFPKVIGNLNNTRLAPMIALPLAWLVRALYPINRGMDLLILRPAHRLFGGAARQDFSTDELRELLEMSEQEGVIDISENEMLQEVVRIGDLHVREVMTPRVDVVAFNAKDPPEKLVDLFTRSHLAKIPVYEGQIDNVTGVIFARAVLLEPDVRKLDLRRLLQPVRFVPDFFTLDRVLATFRQTKSQFAVVVDEYGSVTGVVALEDIVEQMVGDIYAPHDQPERATVRVGPDEYLVAGDLSVADWIQAFGARVDSGQTATVAGVIASRLNRVPRQGDTLELGHLQMTVESMRGRRVERVRLKLLAAENREEAAS